MAKSSWDVGSYDMGCRGTIGLMWRQQCLLVLCAIMLDCWLIWYGSWSGKDHNLFIGS